MLRPQWPARPSPKSSPSTRLHVIERAIDGALTGASTLLTNAMHPDAAAAHYSRGPAAAARRHRCAVARRVRRLPGANHRRYRGRAPRAFPARPAKRALLRVGRGRARTSFSTWTAKASSGSPTRRRVSSSAIRPTSSSARRRRSSSSPSAPGRTFWNPWPMAPRKRVPRRCGFA